MTASIVPPLVAAIKQQPADAIADSSLDRNFIAAAPNHRWVADPTCIWTDVFDYIETALQSASTTLDIGLLRQHVAKGNDLSHNSQTTLNGEFDVARASGWSDANLTAPRLSRCLAVAP